MLATKTKTVIMPLLAETALRAYLGPKLAADAKINLRPVVKAMSDKTWAAGKLRLKSALDRAVKGKLAQDADIEDVIQLLDSLDDVAEEVAAAVDPGASAATVPAAADDDADMMDRLKEVLKAKGMSDENIAAVLAAMKPEVDTPAPAATDRHAAPVVTKAAMDSAITVATRIAAKNAEDATIARLNAVRTAERDVQPFIGEIAIAQDSAPAVYKLALDHLKVDLAGVPAEAYGALLKALPKPGAAKAAAPRIAADAAASSERSKRFPNASRLSQ